ncbi:F-box protein [Trifolium pratense]|uniref:F-box protein n=1 Tax=Trifolium pratense TaxID=57577 RepID=A0A2K3LEJ1_TRIPR|nr:F-box protein [Trifolium pratense]
MQTLVVFEQNSWLYLLSGDAREGFTKKVKLDWPLPFQEYDHDINILGSEINGNLCLYADDDNSKVVVWNPSFEEFKVIPPNLDVFVLPHIVMVASQLHGFGYDYIGDDYKLIRYVEFYPNHNYVLDGQINVPRLMSLLKTIYDYPSWEIYSFKSSHWKKLDLDMPTYNETRVGVLEQVYTKGMCHWVSEGENIDNSYLVSFDLNNEVFSLTSIPSLMDKLEDIHLMLLNEFIALMYKDEETTTFHISILCEIGVKESWMKLFIVESLPCLGHPIGVGKNGNNIFFLNEDEELLMCDLSTHTVQELGVKGAFTCQIVTYKKSLLSIAD